jgi:hypothetical protein
VREGANQKSKSRSRNTIWSKRKKRKKKTKRKRTWHGRSGVRDPKKTLVALVLPTRRVLRRIVARNG